VIKGKLVYMAFGVLFILSACSSGGGSDDDDVSVDPLSGDANEQVDDSIALPGLRVFGLGGQPADQVFNRWLASTTTFRSETFLPEGFPSGTGDITVSTLNH